jgi:hypothetical protein
MVDQVRDRLDAIDKAYRTMQKRGGGFRIAWQQARPLIAAGEWDDLTGTEEFNELVMEARRNEAAIRQRRE